MILRRGLPVVLIGLLLLASSGGAFAQEAGPLAPASPQAANGPGFPYDGRLYSGGGSVSGLCDFQFSLWDAASGGAQVGGTHTVSGVIVTAGLFSASVNSGAQFGPTAYNGDARWLAIAVRCPAGTGVYTALTPRQELSPTPYAHYALVAGSAGAVPWSGITGIPAGFADGVDDSGGGGSGWQLTGNGATASDFLGTTNAVTLTVRVSNTVALRIVPSAGTPNLIGGLSENAVSPGVEGAVIGGGGQPQDIFFAMPNVITGSYGFIGGGRGNTAGYLAVVSGGDHNTASGQYAHVSGGDDNIASGHYAGVGGGISNTASATIAVVAGGSFNLASGGGAVVGGGQDNTASNDYATIGGGQENDATNEAATIGGGFSNLADAYGATVGGGAMNGASGTGTTVAGGEHNLASGSWSTVGGGTNNTALGPYATIAGGYDNYAGSQYTFVGGGYMNSSPAAYATVGGGYQNVAFDPYATVGGGYHNDAADPYATVAGGYSNAATGDRSTIGGGGDNWASATYATVGGGQANFATGTHSFIGSGFDNLAQGSYSTVGGGYSNVANDLYTTTGGGRGNTASGDYATVGGGQNNIASGNYSAVLGGLDNQAAGDGSVAMGAHTRAVHPGSFVFGDVDTVNLLSTTANNQFVVRANGGYFLYTNSALSNGCLLAAGGGSWSCGSDRNIKANFGAVDGVAVLNTLMSLPIETWNYNTQDPSIRHMGPMAQDWYAAFGLGEGETTITGVDADGVALAAIQGLYTVMQAKEARISALEATVAALQAEAGETTRPVETGGYGQLLLGLVLGAGIAAGAFLVGRAAPRRA